MAGLGFGLLPVERDILICWSVSLINKREVIISNRRLQPVGRDG